MTNPLVRVLALAAIAGLVSSAALASGQLATCTRSSHLPHARAVEGQIPQLRSGHAVETASAKERRQRGPRISWQAVA